MKIENPALRHRAIVRLNGYAKALQRIEIGSRSVKAEVDVADGKGVFLDFSDEPEVWAAMKSVCLREIAKANQDLIDSQGHIIQ
jgi:hypothetical protein